jgi:uncharacterized membrane protein YccC
MKKIAVILCIAAALAAATYVYAQTKSAPADPRLDKLLEQNEKVLKNQDDILKKLDELKEGVLQIRRRSS